MQLQLAYHWAFSIWNTRY